MATVFEEVFGHHLHLDAEHRRHILADHPEVRPYLHRLGEVFRAPEWVKRSRRNPHVRLYYRFYPEIFDGKYLLGVARIGSPSIVLTCYITDMMRQGELLWPTG